MGLLSAFGVGGGKLSIEPAASQVQPGGTVSGKVVFTAGKRAQNVTKVTASINCSTIQTVQGQNGPEQRTQSSPIIAPTAVTGPFTSQPGQRHEFPFSFQMPQTAQNSMQGHLSYHLTGSADIDGEIDPGASVELTVVGGASSQFGMPGAMQGAMGGMPGAMGMPGMQPMQQPPSYQVGTQVLAQWQDGQWHPGVIVAMQNGMFGVDWTDPNLGASTWVQPTQLRPAAMPAMQPPMAPPNAPLAIGTQVMAQWQDGQWHPGVIVAAQNGMFGVDWTDPNLGASSWVQPHQVTASAPGVMGNQMMKDAKGGFGGQPGFAAKDPYAGQQGFAAKDPYAGQQGFGGKEAAKDPYAGQQGFAAKDPYAGQQGFGGKEAAKDPYAGQQGFAGKDGGFDPYAGGKSADGALAVGSFVNAQWQDGNWYPARVVAMQNGMIGVDWEDPNLGASTWVQTHQVSGR